MTTPLKQKEKQDLIELLDNLDRSKGNWTEQVNKVVSYHAKALDRVAEETEKEIANNLEKKLEYFSDWADSEDPFYKEVSKFISSLQKEKG